MGRSAYTQGPGARLQELSGEGPEEGLEYPSPSFGYKGDQREGIGRNEEGKGGVGGREERHPYRKEGPRWVGVPSLTDRPLQTLPRSAKQEHHPPWSPLFPSEMLALPETCSQCPRPRRPSEYGWRQLGWGAGWSQESTVTQSQAPSRDTRGCDPADGRARGGRRSHLPLEGERTTTGPVPGTAISVSWGGGRPGHPWSSS